MAARAGLCLCRPGCRRADAQNWDPSVKALTAFPQVLAQMNQDLRWTTDLGNAYYNQPQDVLQTVQVMRQRAAGCRNPAEHAAGSSDLRPGLHPAGPAESAGGVCAGL